MTITIDYTQHSRLPRHPAEVAMINDQLRERWERYAQAFLKHQATRNTADPNTPQAFYLQERFGLTTTLVDTIRPLW